MNSTIQKVDRFHKTKLGYLLFGIAEFAAAYGFISLAIDRGNLFYYIAALIFLVGGLNNLFKLIGKFIHADKKR